MNIIQVITRILIIRKNQLNKSISQTMKRNKQIKNDPTVKIIEE